MKPPPSVRQYLGISLFWFALSFFWGVMLTLVLPQRVAELAPHDKDRTLSVILGLGAAVAIVSQIVFGALSDSVRWRFGRRRPFLVVGTLLTSAALLAFPQAHSVVAIALAYMLIQACLNLANGPYQALIPDQIAPAYHGKASAYMSVCSLLGKIGGPAVAVMVLHHPRGLHQLMYICAGLLNLFMIANVALTREEPPAQAGPPIGQSLRRLFDLPLRDHPSLVWLWLSRFGIIMGVYTVTFCLLYYVTDTLGRHDDADLVIRNFMVFSTIAGILGTLPAGIFADRLSKKTVLYFANGICIIAGLGFLMAQRLAAAYLAVFIFGAGYGAFLSVDWALVCNLLPEGQPAKYMGMWSMSDTLPQIFAPLLAGPLAYTVNAHATGGQGYRVLMGLSMGYFVLGTLALRFVKEKNVVPV